MNDNSWKPTKEEREAIVDTYNKFFNNSMKKIQNFILDIAAVSCYIRNITSHVNFKKKTICERLVESGKEGDWSELVRLLERIIEDNHFSLRDEGDRKLIKIIRASKELKECYRKVQMLRETINAFAS